MSEKAIVFIDGSWLYRCRTALFTKLGEENFEIDYAKLPRLICEDVANTLDEDISLVKTMYFGTIPSSRSGFNTSKQFAFYDFLERSCGYDTHIHEVDVANEDTRASCGWIDVSIATNLVYYSALPAVMDIAVIVGDSTDLTPALKRIRHMGKRIQLVNVSGTTSVISDKSRICDFPVINLDDYAAEVKLVRERVKRVCKKCGHTEDTTWAGIDFFCSNCRGRYRNN